MGMIGDWFNEMAKARQFRQQTKAMLNAIEAQDTAAIKGVWEKIEDKKGFMDSITDDGRGFVDSLLSDEGGGGSTHVFSRLIESAVKTGNLDVFKAVFEQNPDPNYVVSRWSHGDFADIRESYDPVLALAIKSEKKDIALYIAAFPETRKDVVGHRWSRGLMRSDNGNEMDPVPLELARTRPGMKDVFYEMVKLNFPRSAARATAAQDLRPR